MKTILAVLILATTCSCTSARMYPVKGPYSEQKPSPIIEAHISGVLGNNGAIKFDLPDGVKCSGEWSSAAGAGMSATSGSLMSQYGTTYISGYTTNSGTGQNPGQAIALCENGTRFDIEFTTGSGSASGFGIAKDTNGNVFRILF